MRRILVIDGGGCKGVMPAVVLAHIEARTGKKISQLFDLIVGTSVGAILGGIAATGKLSAAKTLELILDTLPRMFTRRMWPLLPKYSRAELIKAWSREIGAGLKMKDLATGYMATAVSVCDGRTHYFKTRSTDDRELEVLQVILRSSAAPLYFGGIVDEDRRTVWLDGGTGIDNCPVLEPLWEVVDRGWQHDGVFIVSLGTGNHDPSQSFERARRTWCRNLREVGLYTSTSDGGLARLQARRSRVEFVEKIAGEYPSVFFNRVDIDIPEKMDLMDGIKYLEHYQAYGEQMVNQVYWAGLVG